MVHFNKRKSISQQIIKKNTIYKTSILGVISLIVPIFIIVLDPVHRIVNYNLRLQIGSVLSNILQSDIKGARLSIYIFNYTNADRFLAGEDPKLKVEDVGPFVFQEYRWYEDLVVSEDGSTMEMTPKFRSEFILEESIAHVEDVNLTMINIPLLCGAGILANFDRFTQSIFSTLTYSMKPLISLNVNSFLWGYKDPLLSSAHALVPSLVYFDTIGLLDRLYDNLSDYRIITGATFEDRFKIKSVKKTTRTHNSNFNNVEVTELNFTNTYEGTGYPPELTPGFPINLYRIGICKEFSLDYIGTKRMEYGGEGLVYEIGKNNFESQLNPLTKEPYPAGIMDISSCFYGLPYAVSKGHYLDADPKLLDFVEGMKPDKDLHGNEFVIDRRVGIPFNTRASVQLNIALNDVSHNRAARKFANTTVPVVRVTLNQPRMSDKIMMLFYLVYLTVPYTLIIIEIVLIITGLALLTSAAKSVYYNWHASTHGMTYDTAKPKIGLTETLSGVPLLISDKQMAGVLFE